ncbi:MAG: ABC-type phospholipid uptake system STAS domain protein MlaB [Idiomarinaceae bacterium HL-53]|nr:MAG: ABC-type phospholipid uptake system STAS domain protein MlaB [Idiomarinaceae bacterium HL-53]CUS47422.1 phospholipid transport system transporter-binding protein [Idiomarinaceae bacterium HL-53]
MSVEFKMANDAVQVRGQLNRNTVPQAWKERRSWSQGEQSLVLDFSAVESVDSAGLAMLIQLKAELMQQKRELVLHAVNPQLEAFAEVSGVTELLELKAQSKD